MTRQMCVRLVCYLSALKKNSCHTVKINSRMNFLKKSNEVSESVDHRAFLLDNIKAQILYFLHPHL